MLILKNKCKRKGHKWFPSGDAREFIIEQQICFRHGCSVLNYILPWGACVRNGMNNPHPMREHYRIDPDGQSYVVISTKECLAPW